MIDIMQSFYEYVAKSSPTHPSFLLANPLANSFVDFGAKALKLARKCLVKHITLFLFFYVFRSTTVSNGQWWCGLRGHCWLMEVFCNHCGAGALKNPS